MVFVIIKGLRSCSDNDELVGYKTDENEAKRYCDEQQAMEANQRTWWSYQSLEEIA